MTCCICCSWQSIQKKRLKPDDKDDVRGYVGDGRKLNCQNCGQFQYWACATEMYKRALDSTILPDELSQCSWITEMESILSTPSLVNCMDNLAISNGICCSFASENCSEPFPLPPIPDSKQFLFDIHDNSEWNNKVKDNSDEICHDHNDNIMLFRREFNSQQSNYPDADDSSLAFLLSYHRHCNQDSKIFRTYKLNNFGQTKRQRRTAGLHMNNIFSGALYLPAFALLIQSQVSFFS